ncbi:MAG: hypothetical protein IPK19_41530 [Chloroflexi bacterium]|nr:hypothetical protein [Chloroflexota bacterium]
MVSQEGSSIEALLEALDSADWDVRINASDPLIAMGVQAHPALISEVRGGSVRRAVNAARVLSSQDAPHIYEAMVGLIASPNPLLGQIAVEYVARYPNSAAVLLDRLNASTYLVRISIVQAFGNLRATEAIDRLIRLPTVRMSASPSA